MDQLAGAGVVAEAVVAVVRDVAEDVVELLLSAVGLQRGPVVTDGARSLAVGAQEDSKGDELSLTMCGVKSAQTTTISSVSEGALEVVKISPAAPALHLPLSMWCLPTRTSYFSRRMVTMFLRGLTCVIGICLSPR